MAGPGHTRKFCYQTRRGQGQTGLIPRESRRDLPSGGEKIWVFYTLLPGTDEADPAVGLVLDGS